MRLLIQFGHPTYLRTLLQRGIIVWALARVVLLVFSVRLGAPMFASSPPVAFILIALLAWLAQLDAHVMREPLFHANLGTSKYAPAIVCVVLVGTLELVIAAVVAVLA